MVLYLLDKFQGREDIRCVTSLVQNTATGEMYHKDIPFIMECLSRLRNRAHEILGDAVASEVCYSRVGAWACLTIRFFFMFVHPGGN